MKLPRMAAPGLSQHQLGVKAQQVDSNLTASAPTLDAQSMAGVMDMQRQAGAAVQTLGGRDQRLAFEQGASELQDSQVLGAQRRAEQLALTSRLRALQQETGATPEALARFGALMEARGLA